MKKIYGLILVLVLLIGMTTMVLAEEIVLTLEEKISVLEETIANLEVYLLTEGISEEDIEIATSKLLESETQLEVLNIELDEELKLAAIATIEVKLFEIEEELLVLESIDTSGFTEEEYQSYLESIEDLNADYKSLTEEYANLIEEEIDQVVELKNAIIVLEERLLDETLTDEEKTAIQDKILDLEEKIEILTESVEAVVVDKTALEEALDSLKEQLEDESLTEEEKEAIVIQIEALKTKLETLNEVTDQPIYERFKMAESLNISPGKMNLLQKLQTESGLDDFVFEDWSDKSVKDIMKEIKTYRKSAQEVELKTDSQEFIKEVEYKSDTEEVKVKNNGKSKGKKK